MPGSGVPQEIYGWRPYILTCSASWAAAMFGYDSSFIGSTLSLASFAKDFSLYGESSTSLSSNITSVFQAGAFFGAIFGYFVGEYLGRKANLIASGLIIILGAALQTTCHGASDLGMMYGGRILTGVGVGASTLICPIYISESAPAAIRGRLIGLFEIFYQLASLVGFWINYGINENIPSGSIQWRIPFAVQMIPAGILVISLPFMTESPRWLAKRGRHESALKSLAWIRNLPADHPYLLDELAQIEAQIESETAGSQGLGELRASWNELTSKKLRFRVVFAMAMKWMSNVSGTNSLTYYTPEIFKSIGFSGSSVGLLATGIYGVVKSVVTVIYTYWLIDRVGRRPLLVIFTIPIILCMFYLGAYSKLSNSFDSNPPRDAGAYMAIIMIYIYAASYCLSWNAAPWIFAAEVFPTKVRAAGMLFSVLNQWLAQFVIVYSTPYMIANIKYGTFFFFGASIFVSGIAVYIFMPETKGFALEDMDLIFANGYIFAPKMRQKGEELRAERDQESRASGPKIFEGPEAVTTHVE